MVKRRTGRNRKAALTTLMIVGEGLCDKAFLEHMKLMFSQNTGQRVTIRSAEGGSPKSIVQSAIRKSKIAEYDKRYVLMDEDIPVDSTCIKLAQKNRIQILYSSPLCLEGMLLSVLNQTSPNTSEGCERKLHPQLSGPAEEKSSYSHLFPEQVLINTPHDTITQLVALISNIQK